MPWGVAAAGISAAAGLGSAAMQSGAAGKAAGQSEHNLQLELPQFQQNYNTAVGAYQPYAAAGTLSLQDQQDLLGLNGQDAADAAMARFQSSPGYAFQLQQGLRAVDAGAAAQGMLRSGATLKAEQTYGQGLANQDFANYYNRLGSLTQTGLSGVSGVVNAGNNLQNAMTGNVSAQNQLLTGAANAQNSILGNATSGLGTTVNSLFSNPQFQNWAGGFFGNAVPGTSGGYNSGADLISPVTGQVTLPPAPPPPQY